MRKRLTQAIVSSLKPKAKRYLVYDRVVPGFAVRVAPSGRKTFCLVARFGGKHPTRRALAVFGNVTVEEARAQAHQLLLMGPRIPQGPTFGAVAEKFLAHNRHLRRFNDFERTVRKEFMPIWCDRQLSDIRRADVLKIIDAALARGAPYAAHHAWAHCRRIFNWAIARGYIEHSPCDRVRARDIIGEKVPRDRVLTDAELRAVWVASESLAYPLGPFFRLLIVTGQRKSEVSNARWAEFDLAQRLWRVPSTRMKSGMPHLVPLSPLSVSILESLSHRTGLLFSTTDGKKPINGFGKAKRQLDTTIGDIEPWRIHDIRRTVRTQLSALRVRTEVAEMVIGHGKRGLARVYDQHQYLDEMREALDLWALRVTATVSQVASGEA